MSTAQEITPFKLTGIEGYNNLRYMRDEFVTTQPAFGSTAATRSRQGIADFREEFFVMTHSYVYHPNLLSLDIGGGPILQRGNFINDTGDTRSEGALYNFSGRANILRDKPYQGAVFFEHLNPTLNVSPGQVVTQENTRYGGEFALLAPVTTMPLYMEATHSHFLGHGADRVIDDQIDRFSLRTSRSFGGLGTTQFQYQTTQQASMSGSPNLPIQGSNSSNQGMSLDSRFQFGSTRQYDLTNLVTINTQSYALQSLSAIPERKDERLFLDLRARHSEKLRSFAFYNYSASNQGILNSTVNSTSAGLNYSPRPDVTAGIGVHGDDSKTTQADTTAYGLDGSLRYQKPLPLGVAQVSYGMRYDQRDQKAAAAQTSVIGERIALIGTTFNGLSHQHVTSGSVTVSNSSRTQTFVEGRDYVLTLVGAETRLQRLISGAIVDGQDLLVDYGYEVGGSYAYTQADQTVNLNWGVMNYFNTYFRYIDAEPRLTSGTPTYPLNVVHSNLYGARADVPLRLRWEVVIGGSAERENRRETISPYRREAEDVYVQTEDPIFGSGNFRLATRRNRVEYTNATQNVNLTGYDLRYWARFWLGVELSATASHESDTGGVTPRRRNITSAKAQWRYRKLNVTFDLGRTLETQGESTRSRALAQIMVRRDF